MRQASWNIGREETVRLMRLDGICGARREVDQLLTTLYNTPDTCPVLVNREFMANRPNQWSCTLPIIVLCQVSWTQRSLPTCTLAKLWVGLLGHP